MKKLKYITGLKRLSKIEQQEISGAVRRSCTQRGRQCCVNYNGEIFCDYGICNNGYSCLWY